MDITAQHQQEIDTLGFTVIPGVYNSSEVGTITGIISATNTNRPTFRKTGDLFAVRQALKEMPGLTPHIFNSRLRQCITQLFGQDYFIVKSIYFDKPGKSNWFVAYHQDLTISVKEKVATDGFGPWTVKQEQYAVQPPLSLLQQNFTIRIHLDDTDHQNGALKVVPGSHNKGIYRPGAIDWNKEQEVSCNVPQGGIMIMKPLLLHASGRTVNEKNRRVLHIEFSKSPLPAPLQWSEKTEIN